MRIWHISDTHGLHDDLKIPNLNQIDVIVHSGDATNSKDTSINLIQLFDFIDWAEPLAKQKPFIYIPGNHDTIIEQGSGYLLKQAGISLFQNEKCTYSFEGKSYKIGTWSYTRKYGDWAYNVENEKLATAFNFLKDCDIVISHSPPYGFLDLIPHNGGLLQIGCPYLTDLVANAPKVKYILCGHVHNNENINNTGVLVHPSGTTISNGAVISDETFEICNNGNILKIIL